MARRTLPRKRETYGHAVTAPPRRSPSSQPAGTRPKLGSAPPPRKVFRRQRPASSGYGLRASPPRPYTP